MTNVSWQSESAEKMHVINERILRYVELKPKLYIPSTLNIDLLLGHTQLIVYAEYGNMGCGVFKRGVQN